MFDRGLRSLQGYTAVPAREDKRREDTPRDRRETSDKAEKQRREEAQQQQRPPPPSNKPLRRPGGKENIYRNQRKVKSPDLAETSFTMSTIEEESEGITVSLKNLQDIV